MAKYQLLKSLKKKYDVLEFIKQSPLSKQNIF